MVLIILIVGCIGLRERSERYFFRAKRLVDSSGVPRDWSPSDPFLSSGVSRGRVVRRLMSSLNVNMIAPIRWVAEVSRGVRLSDVRAGSFAVVKVHRRRNTNPSDHVAIGRLGHSGEL